MPGHQEGGGLGHPPSEQEAEAQVRAHVQQLHDEGVINLDRPAREVIDVIMNHAAQHAAQPAAAAQAGVASAAAPYWLVGDRGWCNHMND